MSSREQMVQRHLPLAKRLAHRYARRGEPAEDLEQVASLALVKAVDRFDPERGRTFEDYAVPTILGELKRYFRDSGWVMGVPRSDKERVLKVRQVVATLSARWGRSPTPGEIAEEAGMDVEEVLDSLELATATRPSSLDSLYADEEGSRKMIDLLGSYDGGLERVEDRDVLARSFRCLRPHERAVLYMRFYEDLTQSEIGELVGCSQMQVSRITRGALERAVAVKAA